MNEVPIKRTNPWLTALIIIIILIIVLFSLAVVMTGLMVPKMIEKVEGKVGEPNHAIEGLKVYIPIDWKNIGDFQVSSSGNCKITGGTVRFEQDRMERILIEDELEHETKTINDIEMSYGFKNNGKEKIYSYYFEDYGYKYLILFVNNVESDIECDTYVEMLEQSITLDPKGKEI